MKIFRSKTWRFAPTLATAGVALAGALVLLLPLAGCTTVVRAPSVQARVVVRDMPPPQVEVIPAPPAADWNWVPGHWVWRDGAWRWAAGHYVQVVVPPQPPLVQETITIAPSAAHVWVRGHWRWGGNAWVWVGGHWVLA